MASIITHTIIPVSLRLILKNERVPNILLFYACAASMLPDLDALAFSFGIPYEHEFGHRGATHSIAFAFLIGVIAIFFHNHLQCRKHIAFSVIFIATVSHPLLDALTNGGLGVALFWPFNDVRIFFPWQPIEVSPIGLKNFLTPRGLEVITSELFTVWLPCMFILITHTLIRFSLNRMLRLRNAEGDAS